MSEETLREEPLYVQQRHAYITAFCRTVRFPIAATVQPNFAFEGRSSRSLRTSSSRNQGDRLRELIKELFYQLDRAYTGCAKPQYLPPEKRFNGFVFPEALQTNPHVHIILSCRNDMERRFRYWFLLWALDTAPAKDSPRGLESDRYNEELAWSLLSRGGRPWMAWTDPYLRSRFLSNLSFQGRRFAPAGTAKVQKLETYNDVENVFVYDTKTWGRAAIRAPQSKSVDVNDYTHNYWELSEHFSRLGIEDPARCCRFDPDHPGSYLPYDGTRVWHRRGGRVVR